jgi:hypothetical protein
MQHILSCSVHAFPSSFTDPLLEEISVTKGTTFGRAILQYKCATGPMVVVYYARINV